MRKGMRWILAVALLYPAHAVIAQAGSSCQDLATLKIHGVAITDAVSVPAGQRKAESRYPSRQVHG